MLTHMVKRNCGKLRTMSSSLSLLSSSFLPDF